MRSTTLCRAAGLALLLAPSAAAARDLPDVKITADTRLRVESDIDSHTPEGDKRPDRTRLRIRARVMAEVELGGGFRLQARVRTGTSNSQQGANVTFADLNGNPNDVFKVTEDRFSLRWKGKAGQVEIGRMEYPFFTTNEYSWDADISPLGGAVTLSVPLASKTRLRLIGGGFVLPVGLVHYTGRLFAGQAVVESGPASIAGGVFRFEGDRSNPDRLILLDGNGSRDYTVLALVSQYKVQAAGEPLTFSADVYRNVQGYAHDPDPVARANADQRTGFIGGIAWGDVKSAQHLQLGYRYFRIERFALNSSYAHDDAARLGDGEQSALTDLAGHDLYASYAVTRHLTAGVRAIFSQRITNVEDDTRGRFDLSYVF